MKNYSVLMSVYDKEDPVFFRKAIDSMLNQSVLTNDFVIVCDGPLSPELDEVLNEFTKQNQNIFQVIRLKENVGIGAAANIGLQHCKNDLIAKMDSDDISVPQRCELQLRAFEDCPNLTVLGGYLAEFENEPEDASSIRAVPLTNDEIREFARRRQPFNNVTVMFRKEAVVKVGGYKCMGRSEDFDLYIRLLHAGFYAQNLPDILTYARFNHAAAKRRASWQTLKGCVQSRWNSMRIGYCSFFDFLSCVAGQLVIWICPTSVQEWIYQKFLRKSTEEQGKAACATTKGTNI